MTSSYDKKAHLSKAKEWLASGEPASIRYTSLELRMCIEAIVYEKLEYYKNYVPGVVFSKWQPAHAMNMLKQFEPNADEDCRLAIAPESSPGVMCGPLRSIGEHRFFPTKWLNKNYHRLGRHLHVQRVAETASEEEPARNQLSDIIEKIDYVLAANIRNVSLAERVHFTCELCDTNCLANAAVVRETSSAFCINPNCGAEYRLTEVDNGFQVELLKTEFICLKCGDKYYFANTQIDVGVVITCYECKAEHVICTKQWGYSLKEEVAEESS